MVMALYLLSLLFALGFLHPYLTYPLSLRCFRARPVAQGDGDRPSASLLFAAYNEERVLPAKLANIEAIKRLHPELEVIAYSDCGSDRTLELLEGRPDLLRVIAASERTGKAMGMRQMVEEAHGDICIFTDANVILAPQSVTALLDHFRSAKIGGVSGTLHYVNDADSATALAGGLYWRLEEGIKTLESRCGSMMGADGSIFAVRRALYPEVPPHLLDDMIASMSVIFAGYRLISADDVIAHERNTTDPRDEFRRKRRIACRAWNSHRHLWPHIVRSFSLADRYKYVSHKLLRWFGAPLAIAAASCFTGALLLGGHVVPAIFLWLAGGLAAVLGSALTTGPLSTLWQAWIAICATFAGIIDAWRGRSYQTWVPAKSRD